METHERVMERIRRMDSELEETALLTPATMAMKQRACGLDGKDKTALRNTTMTAYPGRD